MSKKRIEDYCIRNGVYHEFHDKEKYLYIDYYGRHVKIPYYEFEYADASIHQIIRGYVNGGRR